jgi:hypothetical protein
MCVESITKGYQIKLQFIPTFAIHLLLHLPMLGNKLPNMKKKKRQDFAS